MFRAVEAAHQPIRVSAFPPGVTSLGNPYFTLCHSALAARGIRVTDDLEIGTAWLQAHGDQVDAVHLHWPERFWREGFGGAGRVTRGIRAIESLWQLQQFLRAARRRGIRSMWTVHNLEPHEGAYRWDRYGYRLVARHCDLVICHSESAARATERFYRPRGRMIVMRIGDPSPAYPAPRPRADVLADFGLDPQRPVVSCLGRLREYKGLDVACAAVERLNGRVQLAIGGPVNAGFDLTRLRKMIERMSSGVVIARPLADQEFADLTAASDAVLLPYRAITGSSALLAAVGLGRGVVASKLPYFEEILADEPDAGVMVPGWDAAAWADGILRLLARPPDVRTAAALRLANRCSWDRCVEPLAAAVGAATGAERAEVRAATAW
jgi:glycosyltransferase involved in cell wall biosynthesis